MRILIGIGIFGLTVLLTAGAWSYPLDGYPYTGILRLEGFRLAQQGEVKGIRLPPGALLPSDRVDLRLLNNPDFRIPPADPELTMAVKKLLGNEADRYGLAVLDLTDGQHPRYMEHQASDRANPGSVGKLMVALGIFQALADIYPDEIEKRLEILRTAEVTADEFILTDHHNVPFWSIHADRVSYRPVQTGDRANLWTYLDWMLSASSNAAASIVMKELMLLVHFGAQYPVSADVSRRFFSATPKTELGDLLARALQAPITRNGLDLEQLRQGSFFTANGKKLVPGTTSYATPRELMHYLIKLEQGKLVDAFSSREIKRLLYMTQGRIRYASAPALGTSAVYFKSGSLYKCRPEPDFTCRKYQGNVLNMLNSVATVESPAGERRLFYLVTVMSNVLRKNSAVVHQTLATRIHRLMEAYHGGSAVSGKTDRSEK